jgi:hypothetical protein
MSAKISVRATGPNTYAVFDADDQIVHDGFTNPQVGWMWAARRGLHQGRDKRKREATTVPTDLGEERLLKLKEIAYLENRSYGEVLRHAKAGAYGELIQAGERDYRVRCGDYRQSVTARQIRTK